MKIQKYEIVSGVDLTCLAVKFSGSSTEATAEEFHSIFKPVEKNDE